MTALAEHSREESSSALLFKQGFLALLPLWTGAIPFGIAYGVTATEIGLSAFAVQLMSLTVFSAAAQITAVSLFQVGASSLEIIVTACALNLHLPLIGAAIAHSLRFSWPSRLITAWLLTDGSFAVAAGRPPLRKPILLGAGFSMYLGWNLGTALGLIAGQTIPDPRAFAIDFVVPLTFLSVLIPLLRTRIALMVAVVSAAGTLALATQVPLGFAILIAGLSASLLGAFLSRGSSTDTSGDSEEGKPEAS